MITGLGCQRTFRRGGRYALSLQLGEPQLQEQIKTVGDKTKGVTVTIAQEL